MELGRRITSSPSAIRAAEALGSRAFAIAGVVLGLDFMVTGALGFCPLCHQLGSSLLAPRRADR